MTDRDLLLEFRDWLQCKPEALDDDIFSEREMDAFLAELSAKKAAEKEAARKANICPKCGKLDVADTRDSSILCWCNDDE